MVHLLVRPERRTPISANLRSYCCRVARQRPLWEANPNATFKSPTTHVYVEPVEQQVLGSIIGVTQKQLCVNRAIWANSRTGPGASTELFSHFVFCSPTASCCC